MVAIPPAGHRRLSDWIWQIGVPYSWAGNVQPARITSETKLGLVGTLTYPSADK